VDIEAVACVHNLQYSSVQNNDDDNNNLLTYYLHQKVKGRNWCLFCFYL